MTFTSDIYLLKFLFSVNFKNFKNQLLLNVYQIDLLSYLKIANIKSTC